MNGKYEVGTEILIRATIVEAKTEYINSNKTTKTKYVLEIKNDNDDDCSFNPIFTVTETGLERIIFCSTGGR